MRIRIEGYVHATSLSQWVMGAWICLVLAVGQTGAQESIPPAAQGIYVSAHTVGSARIGPLVDGLIKAGGNALVFDVKDRLGRLSYQSEVALAEQIDASARAQINNPQQLVGSWRQRGLYIVARLTCFHDALLAQKRPDLVPLSRKGNGLWSEKGTVNWVDPALPEVQQYLIDLALEVAALGVDEIQLDYVRFPTGGDLSDAVFSFDPAALPKDAVITDFVRRVHEALAPMGTRLSADVFGVAAWGSQVDVSRIGQNLPDLFAHLDVVSPMLYPSHFESGFDRIPSPVDYPYYFLYQGCRRLRTLAEEHGVEVRPWVQSFDYRVKDFDASYISEQLYGAEAGGARGWLLWNSASRYDIGLQAIAQFLDGTSPVLDRSVRFPSPLGALLPTDF
jgi:hypothetical protein